MSNASTPAAAGTAVTANSPFAAHHREDVGGCVQRGKVDVGNASEEPGAGPERRGVLLEPLAVAAIARDGHLDVGVEAAHRVQQHVEALAGHESAHADDERALRREAEPLARCGAGAGIEGTESRGVDPW